MNPLRHRHEIFMGTRHGQKLGRVQKWLHSNALRRASDDLTSLTLLANRLSI